MNPQPTFFEMLFSRRSIRRFLPQPVPREMIERVLTAATWAPSAHNRQPWRFAVVESASAKQSLAKAMGRRLRQDLEADGVSQDAIEKDLARSYRRISSAPVLILVCLSMADMDRYPDERRQRNEWIMATQSTAMAGQNLLLAAHAAGLSACWMCAPLFCPDVINTELDLPDDWQAQGLVVCGYAAESRKKERKPLSARVRFEKEG